MVGRPMLLKQLLVAFWAAWLTIVLATNLCDAGKAAGLLDDSWPLASGNYAFVCQTTARCQSPPGGWPGVREVLGAVGQALTKHVPGGRVRGRRDLGRGRFRPDPRTCEAHDRERAGLRLQPRDGRQGRLGIDKKNKGKKNPTDIPRP